MKLIQKQNTKKPLTGFVLPVLILAFLAFSFVSYKTATSFKPNKRVVITKCGAVGDSVTLNTTIIQKAIDSLNRTGGGTLVVPKGIFLTGAIYLKQGVDLEIEKDGVLKGSANKADYPPVDRRIEGHIEPQWCPALINAKGINNLKIYGEGTIQGGGKPFWDDFWNGIAKDKAFKNLDSYRPQNLFVQDCKNVLVKGLKFRNSGFWNFHLYRCQQVKIENLDIQTPRKAPSTDGIDIDSSQDVDITGCTISVDDDCIALKGTKGPFAMQDTTSRPTERIRITNCKFNLGFGAITFGSEGTIMRDITLKNCTIKGDKQNALLRIKVRTDTPQLYENVLIDGIYIDGPYILLGLAAWNQYKDLKGQKEPDHTIRNITLKNISGRIAHFVNIVPPKCATVSNITIENVNVTTLTPSFKATVKDVANFEMKNAIINGKPASEFLNKESKLEESNPIEPK